MLAFVFQRPAANDGRGITVHVEVSATRRRKMQSLHDLHQSGAKGRLRNHPAPVEAGRRDLRSRTGQWVGLPSVTAPEGSYFKVLGTAFRRDDEVKL